VAELGVLLGVFTPEALHIDSACKEVYCQSVTAISIRDQEMSTTIFSHSMEEEAAVKTAIATIMGMVVVAADMVVWGGGGREGASAS